MTTTAAPGAPSTLLGAEAPEEALDGPTEAVVDDVDVVRAAPPPAVKESANMTTFFMFETNDGGNLWKFLGTQDATGRDQAERLFFGKPKPDGDARVVCAVTLAGWQPHTRSANTKVTTVVDDFPMTLVATRVTQGPTPVEDHDDA